MITMALDPEGQLPPTIFEEEGQCSPPKYQAVHFHVHAVLTHAIITKHMQSTVSMVTSEIITIIIVANLYFILVCGIFV